MEDEGLNIKEIGEFLVKKGLSSTSIDNQIEENNRTIQSFIDRSDLSSSEYIELNRKNASLSELRDNIYTLETLLNNYKQAEGLLNDPELAEVALGEINEIKEQIKADFEKVQDLTVKPLKNDDKKAILEFRPGVGGVEASLFAEDLFRMYTRYCNEKGYNVENISLDYDPSGGIKEAIVIVNNEGSFGKLRFESGVHRVQRVPKTESLGRIHTSTASLVILPKVDNKDINIKPDELRIDVFRAGGPGGQSVNRTDSAVRVTHLPTGITVSCQAGKSQHKNKEMALSILLSKLNEIEESKISNERSELRESSMKDSDRSSKIRTFNFAQSRVTDHRIGKSWFNLEEILGGDLDEIINTVSRELRKE